MTTRFDTDSSFCEVKYRCSSCFNSLKGETTVFTSHHTSYIVVEPCESCLHYAAETAASHVIRYFWSTRVKRFRGWLADQIAKLSPSRKNLP